MATLEERLPSSRIPTIGIDCRFAATRSGIGRYTQELVQALLKRNDPWRYVLFVADAKGHGLGALPHSGNFQFSIFNFQHYSIGEQLFFPRAIQRSKVSLMHFPHFNAPLFCSIPFIATIHDLILHTYPNEASFLKRAAYRLLMRSAVTRAQHLIAVSRFTAEELAKMYGENVQRKTSVIHEGISENFHPASESEKRRITEKYRLPSHFLLYVGAAKEHKNVQTLIDACQDAEQLVLVTGGKEAARLRLRPNTRILEGVDDNDLPALYSLARCFVLPSLAEGFGLPILEAMACGCPVVASNCASIPEIAGGHALLVEPTVKGLSEGIRKVESGPPFAPAELRRGKQWKVESGSMEHARSFTWERAAEETAKVYASVLSYVGI